MLTRTYTHARAHIHALREVRARTSTRAFSYSDEHRELFKHPSTHLQLGLEAKFILSSAPLRRCTRRT
eukprot:1667546-Pleurochrysis_carterae.AAC.2